MLDTLFGILQGKQYLLDWIAIDLPVLSPLTQHFELSTESEIQNMNPD